MRACIGSNRAPDGRYAEIDLPASPYRLLNALDEIGIKSTKEIVYQEILNYGSFGYLEPHFDEYTMLEELNALAQKLAVFDRVDSIAFEGLVKMAEQKPEPFGVKELINFAHSTESCHVVSDVFDDEQLGRFYAGNGFMPEYETLPDKIYEHLDFAKIGREAQSIPAAASHFPTGTSAPISREILAYWKRDDTFKKSVQHRDAGEKGNNEPASCIA